MTRRRNDLKRALAQIDDLPSRPPMRHRDGLPLHVFEMAEIEIARSVEHCVALIAANVRHIGKRDFAEAMEVTRVIKMEVRRHGDYETVRQTVDDWLDVPQTRTGIEQKRVLLATNQIIPVHLMIARLSDRKCAGGDVLDRKPVIEPAQMRSERRHALSTP